MLCLYTYTGNDFDEAGFAAVIEYYYAASIEGVTRGLLSVDKVQATLQAAHYFGLDKLSKQVQDWVKHCGLSATD
jgi:hypothetical protein